MHNELRSKKNDGYLCMSQKRIFERLLEKAPSFDDNDKDKLWRRGTHTHKRMETWTEKLDKFVDNSAETVVRNWIC